MAPTARPTAKATEMPTASYVDADLLFFSSGFDIREEPSLCFNILPYY